MRSPAVRAEGVEQRDGVGLLEADRGHQREEPGPFDQSVAVGVAERGQGVGEGRGGGAEAFGVQYETLELLRADHSVAVGVQLPEQHFPVVAQAVGQGVAVGFGGAVGDRQDAFGHEVEVLGVEHPVAVGVEQGEDQRGAPVGFLGHGVPSLAAARPRTAGHRPRLRRSGAAGTPTVRAGCGVGAETGDASPDRVTECARSCRARPHCARPRRARPHCARPCRACPRDPGHVRNIAPDSAVDGTVGFGHAIGLPPRRPPLQQREGKGKVV